MGEMIVAHDIRHGLKANQQIRADGLRRRDTSIAAALSIAPSCVSKWKRRLAETGSLEPGRVGGRKKRTLSGERADWLRERCQSGPFTTRGLVAELAERGIKTDRRAVWVFVRAEGLSFKKNSSAG